MGSASLRKYRVLALSLAAVVGSMTLAVSPVLAAPGTGPVASENVPAPDVNAGEAYTQFIVSFKKTPGNSTPSGRANAWGAAARQQGVSVQELRTLATGGTLIASDKALSDQAAEDFMDGIVASGAVNAVEPDARMTAVLSPNDTEYSKQWDLFEATGMSVPGAWDFDRHRRDGRRHRHRHTRTPGPRRQHRRGYDFIADTAVSVDGNGRDGNPSDPGDWYAAGECGQTAATNSSWHGTHVAGTIAAVTNNSKGVAGIALRREGLAGPRARQVRRLRLRHHRRHHLGVRRHRLRRAGQRQRRQGHQHEPRRRRRLRHGLPERDQPARSPRHHGRRRRRQQQRQRRRLPARPTATTSSPSPPPTPAAPAYYSNFGAIVDIAAPGGETASAATASSPR